MIARLMSLIIALMGTLFVNFSHVAIQPGTKTLNHQSQNTASCPQTPANFNFLSATSDSLRYYGLPPRPTVSSDINEWLKIVENRKYRTCGGKSYSGGQLYNGKPLFPGGRLTDESSKGKFSSIGTSHIWSGEYHFRTTKDGIRLRSARGYFTMECDTTPGNYHGTWIGLGGIYSPYFWQAVWSARDETFLYQYWTPNGLVYNDTMPISNFSCGDIGYIYVDYNFEISNSVYAYVYDLTSNASNESTNTPDGGSLNVYTDQESAEWIDERAGCNAGLYHFGGYGTVYWDQTAFAYTNTQDVFQPIDYDTYYVRLNANLLYTPQNQQSNPYYQLSQSSGITGHDSNTNYTMFHDTRTSIYDDDTSCTG